MATLLAGVPAGRAEAPPPAATILWKFSFAGRLPYNSSRSTPARAEDGTLYQATFYGTVYALTPDGREKWRFHAGREIQSSPAIADDGTLYFGARDRKFYAVTPAGKLKWSFATGAWVDSSPAIAADGTIVFGGWDGNFYALRPDGSLKWKYAVGAIVDSSPAIGTDGTIYFGAHDNFFYALHPDGSLRWKFSTGGAIISSPAIGAEGTLYFTSLDGSLYAVNPDGSEQWHYPTGSITKSSPVVAADGSLCLGLNDQTLVVSRAGQKLWHTGSPMPVEVSAVAWADHFGYSVPWRHVCAVKFSDQRLWQADLDETVSASLMVDGRGIVYACAGSGLYALQPPGEPVPPAKSSWPMFRANPRHTGRVETKP